MSKCALDIRKDIINDVSKRLTSEGAFVEDNIGYFPNPNIASSVIQSINKSFNNNPVVQEGEKGSFSINPSDTLVNIYLEQYNRQLEDEAKLLQQQEIERGGYTEEQRGEFFQLAGETEGSKASPKTIAMLKDFLKRIGVDVQSAKSIIVNGQKLDANAAAQLTQKLIQVIESKEAQALPEEAMHFAVEIIKQTNPKLYQQLLKEINGYAILNNVFAEYSKNPYYQTKDGKPDVLKIKEEAIGKLLAEVVIKRTEGFTEKPEQSVKVQNWWLQIIDWLKGLFIKSGFDQAAMDIISGKNIGTVDDIRAESGKVMLQQSKQEHVFTKLKDIASRIEKRNDGYYINGKKVPNRVTDIVSDWYSRRFADKALTNDEYQDAVNTIKKDKGTDGHKDMEEAFNLFVDPTTGLLRDEPLDDSNYTSFLNPKDRKMYETLRDNLRLRLESFPTGTKFMSEAMIYDAKRNLAGTVDFLAIDPDGKVSILDWKFMDLNTDYYEDVPWYKVSAWQTQMEQYKLILQQVYNVKPEDFGQTRMIPILSRYSEGNAKKKIYPQLLSVRIGDVVVDNIKDDYLLPVGLEEETTGSEEIDDYLKKLNAIYKQMSEKKALPSERLTKAEQLNSLYKAIRQLQMKRNLAPLIKQSKILNKQVSNIFTTFETKFQGKDAKSFSEDERSEFAGTISTAIAALETYTEMDTELGFIFDKPNLTEKEKELQSELSNAAGQAKRLKSRLLKLDKTFTDKYIGESEDTKKASAPEKVIKGFSKWFGTTATIQMKAMHILFKKATRAFTLAGMDTAKESRKLLEMKKKYDDWARSKGLSNKDYFNMIRKVPGANKARVEAERAEEIKELDKIKEAMKLTADAYNEELTKINAKYDKQLKDNNELIDEFDPKFYRSLKSDIAAKNFDDIRENIDIPAYREHLEQKLQEEYDRIDAREEIGTDEEIRRRKQSQKADAKKLYNLSTTTSPGWLLYDEIKKFPKRDKWESKEWKELHKKDAQGNYVNQPAIDFYNYIIEKNKEYMELGYISAAQARTFLPFVRKGTTEKLVLGGKLSPGEQFLRSISMDEGDFGYGQRDPISGKLVNRIPIYLTREIEGEISTDLFRTMALYNEFAIRYKYLKGIEEQAKALLRLEQNKSSIATSYFGKTEYKNGKIQYNPENNDNSKLYEDMMKAIIYGQKFIESETFDQVLGSFSNVGEKINKKLGFKLMPEGLQGRQVSINKVISQLNTTFQIQALGLNVLSSMSNLFGGKTQSLINSGKYFTKADFVATEMWLMGNKLGGQDKKLAIGALDYFMPFIESYNREFAKKLSLSKLSQESIQDWLMILMRGSDKAVQTTNFFAYLRNTVVVNGEVVNAREYVRQQPEYKEDMYKGTQAERKARAERFEEEVKKLIEEKGIMKVAKIENDEFVIPGVNQKDESVVNLRTRVQQITSDALGSMTEANKRLINLNIYGNSFMVFKNWIPRLVDVRMGNLKYNAASDAYEWGRMRMLFRVVGQDFFRSLDSLKSSIGGNDEKWVQQMKDLYQAKKAEYEQDTNKELEMTEAEFIDLVTQNIKNQLLDVLIFTALIMLLLGLKGAMPDDKEDPIVRNQYKFMLKAMDKFTDEIGYFYDPTSITKLVSQGIFPATGLIDNIRKGFGNFLKENYALATGDEEMAEKNYVIKYWMRTFPITSQAASYMPMFLPDLAKDLGIKMQSTSGIR